MLSKSTGAVLLLTAAIEWLTQRHFKDAIKDDAGLDPLTKDVFRAHWLEESQHARMEWDPLESTCRHASLSIL